jgi:hypothetical protein
VPRLRCWHLQSGQGCCVHKLQCRQIQPARRLVCLRRLRGRPCKLHARQQLHDLSRRDLQRRRGESAGESHDLSGVRSRQVCEIGSLRVLGMPRRIFQ